MFQVTLPIGRVFRRGCDSFGDQCGREPNKVKSGLLANMSHEIPTPISSKVTSPAGTPLRVLLVEDGFVNQRVAVGLLEQLGHHVQIAEDGKAAVDQWREHDFDVILMDWQMPVMDGKAATRMIREEEKKTGAHIPIVAMTASSVKGDRESCLHAGMDDFISKPIDPQALSIALSKINSS